LLLAIAHQVNTHPESRIEIIPYYVCAHYLL
jgi:hypothetical protein